MESNMESPSSTKTDMDSNTELPSYLNPDTNSNTEKRNLTLNHYLKQNEAQGTRAESAHKGVN